MENYVCKECGKEVVVEKDRIVRICEHKGTVILNMEMTLTGNGVCS